LGIFSFASAGARLIVLDMAFSVVLVVAVCPPIESEVMLWSGPDEVGEGH
jgi:hypothetical protein